MHLVGDHKAGSNGAGAMTKMIAGADLRANTAHQGLLLSSRE